jgi:RNase P subunit RPR2
MWVSRCSTCRRPATRIITGRVRGKSLYSALTCDDCAPKHRALAQKAGPVVEEELEDRAQGSLF